jgi:hypothetical protein
LRLLHRFGLAVVFFIVSCGGSGPLAPRTTPPKIFTPYQGQATVLFDDQIDPNAVGLADVQNKPQLDPVLRARAQTAEAVARVRVATVTVDSAAGKPVYLMNLDLTGGSIARRGFDDEQIEIAVRSDSPAFGVVKWLDTRLIDRTFVAFFHRFAGPDEVELKFHLSADNPEVLAAVREAAALREISGK